MLNVRLLLTSATLTVSPAWSAQPSLFPPLHETLVTAAGWQGFTDIALIADVLLTLTLAAFLGAIIAFHPKNRAAMAMSEGIDSPKIYVIYPVIGAIVGIMVLHYGMVVGFVLFGIGGLLRFRTVLRSATLTGRIIFATLMGLACGMHLPHIAVLATAFGFTVAGSHTNRPPEGFEGQTPAPNRIHDGGGSDTAANTNFFKVIYQVFLCIQN